MKLTASIDVEAADRAADRIVLACEIGEVMNTYADDDAELQALAITITQLVSVFAMAVNNVPEKQAVTEFTKLFRAVRRHINRLGKGVRLSDVIAEMSLDQGKERAR